MPVHRPSIDSLRHAAIAASEPESRPVQPRAPHGFGFSFLLNETDLVRISAPTLSIYGGEDPVGSEALWEEYVRLSPNAELHIVPDTGHLPWFDHPTEVAEEVRRHLIS